MSPAAGPRSETGSTTTRESKPVLPATAARGSASAATESAPAATGPAVSAPGPGDRLAFCTFLAAAIHAALILGVTFTAAAREDNITQSIEVTLARHSEPEPPAEADFLASSNQQGSGALDEKRETTTTERSDFHDNVIREVHEDQAPETEPERANPDTRSVASSTTEQAAQVLRTPAGEDQPVAPTARPARRQPADIAQAIATLEARLAAERQEYARRPRIRRLTSVSTRSAEEAYYLNAWRRRIESIGNLNYPGEARRRKLAGSLRMLVAVNADGSLRDVQILESSGFNLLDDAAVHIVQLAAPYSPFPRELAKNTDVIEIIRTWRFGRNSYFSGGQL